MLCSMIDKLLKFPSVLRLKYSTKYYRWLFRKKGITFGNNMSILGRISVIGSGKIVIGDNFCMTSGEHINPISSNLQASFFTDSPEAQIRILIVIPLIMLFVELLMKVLVLFLLLLRTMYGLVLSVLFLKVLLLAQEVLLELGVS